MNRTQPHHFILKITFVIGMILTSSAFSKEVENLLMDPDFEEPVLGWSLSTRAPAAATLTIDKNEKKVGQASARIEITDVGNGSSVHNLTLDNHADIAVKANTTYTVDFWTKAEADRTLIIDALLNQDPWTNLFRVRDLLVTTEWARIHHTFQADATLSPVVFLFSFVDSKMTIWLDHVRFYEGEFDEEDGGLESAFDPNPADGSMHVDTWVTLSWKSGDFAVSHDVYLGENRDDVEAAMRDSELFRGNQNTTFYVAGFPGFAYPEGLVPGTTYYWRIDEVNDANPDSPWKGDVWSFTIPPKTAYNPDPADGTDSVPLTATLTWTGGFNAKLHTVYFGDNFDDISNAAGGPPQGAPTYKPASLQSEKVYYWRVDEFDGVDTYKGDVWAFSTPSAVESPQPANGAKGEPKNAQLIWTPAANAISHDLYFGTDKDAVKTATTASAEYVGNKAPGSESHDPGVLTLGTTYYWRVDAVYNSGPVKGLIWSFTIADFIMVDDFESYNDFDPPDPNSNRIFDSWIDGFGTTDNGALVGNDLPPYAEQTIVHGGAQSMIYRYDNVNKTSEATLTLVYPRDWTEEGITKLSLWFRGTSSNSAERMYIALNGTAVVYHDNTAATQEGGWNQWVIDLQAFADQGVNLTNVNTITIGIGTKDSPAAGGTGTVYFDDIRLVR